VADTQPVVWEAENHTIVKHRLLRGYFNAWLPILSQQGKKVGATDQPLKFIDGFAGPGVYSGGEKGSPILTLEAALNHSIQLPVPVEFVFIENRADRCSTLTQQLAAYQPQIASSSQVRVRPPVCGDSETVITKMLNDAQRVGRRFGPALVFLDQFGYSDVTMGVINRIMSCPQCEVLSYLLWRDLQRFISDETKHAGITAAFGGEEWRPAIGMSGAAQITFFRDSYLAALRQRGGAKYVWPFSMFDENGRLLYWLFFSTNNLEGLRQMKKAMWGVDQTGGFAYSDADGLDQQQQLKLFNERWLAEEMAKRLAGKTLRVEQIDEFVLVETPSYLFKEALAILEKAQRALPVNPPATRRPGTYPDPQLQMRFEASMF
jgi:three-Cys-motif partner protein